MKQIIDVINKIWEKEDKLDSWIGVLWLIKKQLDEIKDENYTAKAVLKESADILIILIRYLDHINIDVKKLILWRLNTRHRGKTKKIVEKYTKMFEEENL